jgi:FKBP-type peptidyl-prolyl cis-trans isomerase SlyD
MLQIAKDTVVSLNYRLLGADGKLLERTQNPISYLHGGYRGIFAPVERELEGKQAGFACEVQLFPEDAFGEYDEEYVRVESRSLFPPDVRVGMQFEGAGQDSRETRIYTVTDIAQDKVVVDGNHPLAGQTVVFSCEVTDVRPATVEEVEHGHVHGHGHSH